MYTLPITPTPPLIPYFSPIQRMCWSWSVVETVAAVISSASGPQSTFPDSSSTPFPQCFHGLYVRISSSSPHSWILHFSLPGTFLTGYHLPHPGLRSVTDSSLQSLQFPLTRNVSESKTRLEKQNKTVLPVIRGITPVHRMTPVFSFVKQA